MSGRQVQQQQQAQGGDDDEGRGRDLNRQSPSGHDDDDNPPSDEADPAVGPSSSTLRLREYYASHGVDLASLGKEAIVKNKEKRRDGRGTATVTSSQDDNLSIVDDDRPAATSRPSSVRRHRFVRLNPRHDRRQTLLDLRAEIVAASGASVDSSVEDYPIPVRWLSLRREEYSGGGDADGTADVIGEQNGEEQLYDYYAVPHDFAMSKSDCYRRGAVYGQDVSSGAAVIALLSDRYDGDDSRATASATTTNDDNRGHHQQNQKLGKEYASLRVLDLCCSPGIKLCAIADLLSCRNTGSILRATPTAVSPSKLHQALLPSIVIGVDVSESRMAVCKRVVHKYQIDPETCGRKRSGRNQDVRIQLFCNDGTTFGENAGSSNASNDTLQQQRKQKQNPNLVFDSEVAREQVIHRGQRKRMNKSARVRERKRLKQIMAATMTQQQHQDECDLIRGPSSSNQGIPSHSSVAMELFDRVLVDAECSTDGSLRHVEKRIQKEQKLILEKNQGDEYYVDFDIPQLTDRYQLEALLELQRRLASQGFRLLKPDGIMVYSTCSFSEDQNEGVVEWLLREHLGAELVPLDFRQASCCNSFSACPNLIESRRLPGTARFLPYLESSNAAETRDGCLFGEGFFLAKIMKKQQ